MTTDTNQKDLGKPPPRWVLKTMTRIHVFLHRLSGGHMLNKLGGDDVCFVTMTGAKSGRTLTIPLMYVPYNDGVLLVASQGGAPKNPVWYYNIAADPNIEVTVGGQARKMLARQVSDEEKAALWPHLVSLYPDFDEYQARTDRNIPVFECSPS